MFPAIPEDLSLQLLLNQHWRNAALDFVLPLFSLRAPLFVILAGLLVWRSALRGKTQVAYFLLLALAMGATDLGTNVAKHAVGRVRPQHAVAGTYRQESGQWVRLPADHVPDRERGTSFPSAHAANSMALAVLAMCLWPKLRRGLWALPLVVGWSRVYLGKHYPLDVAAGWLLGALVGWLFWLGWKRLAPRLKMPTLPDDIYRPVLR
ncbi:undecaprenyl-diphosphatase [Humidesulfovibrio mexicanus]|uniref:Undecaprenyl-diphosphatase n=1 Tax=Humidesulfovibrio mexicanus TaxID=147047 RepID=A0A239BIU7_9BACT|nr:phosphatase PAP2 family protein [Humidesulfovibrio mexicanus]SNS07890.1 undecaprenyl-diphosphatase [Humidesulfovibrio mexicanus]